MRSLLLAALLLPSAASAQDCASLRAESRRAFAEQFRLGEHRALTRRIVAAQTGREKSVLADLAARFRAAERIEDRMDLQLRARAVVRDAAKRAGHRPLNPFTPSPYDAHIRDAASPDGRTGYLVEARSLLIQPDPAPHVTLWITRSDPERNPRLLINVGVKPAAEDDYVRYGRGRATVQTTVTRFLEEGLPPGCR